MYDTHGRRITAYCDEEGCVGAMIPHQRQQEVLRAAAQMLLHPIGIERIDADVALTFGADDALSEVQAALDALD